MHSRPPSLSHSVTVRVRGGDFRIQVVRRVLILFNHRFKSIRLFLCSVDGEVLIIEYAGAQYSHRSLAKSLKSAHRAQLGSGAMKKRGKKLEGFRGKESRRDGGKVGTSVWVRASLSESPRSSSSSRIDMIRSPIVATP